MLYFFLFHQEHKFDSLQWLTLLPFTINSCSCLSSLLKFLELTKHLSCDKPCRWCSCLEK